MVDIAHGQLFELHSGVVVTHCLVLQAAVVGHWPEVLGRFAEGLVLDGLAVLVAELTLARRQPAAAVGPGRPTGELAPTRAPRVVKTSAMGRPRLSGLPPMPHRAACSNRSDRQPNDGPISARDLRSNRSRATTGRAMRWMAGHLLRCPVRSPCPTSPPVRPATTAWRTGWG
jgi:hypothetical protein